MQPLSSRSMLKGGLPSNQFFRVSGTRKKEPNIMIADSVFVQEQSSSCNLRRRLLVSQSAIMDIRGREIALR